MASAKLIVTMPTWVLLLIGEMNKPVLWRAPMVTISNKAASRVSGHQPNRCGLGVVGVVGVAGALVGVASLIAPLNAAPSGHVIRKVEPDHNEFVAPVLEGGRFAYPFDEPGWDRPSCGSLRFVELP